MNRYAVPCLLHPIQPLSQLLHYVGAKMKRLVLTTEEAAILSALGRSQEAFVPELAAAAKLSLSELRDGIARLEDKGFACTNGHLVRLTKSGSEIQHNVMRNRATVFFV